MTLLQPSRHQRGGTFLGFILGVLVGLAGALGVAVYVTKVPVPFIDRAISRKSSDDTAESERNKDWNPNASLNASGKATKPPAPEAGGAAKDASAAAVVPDAAPPAKKGVKSADAPASKAAEPTETVQAPAKGQPKVYSTDPLGDLAQAKSQGKTVAATEPSKPAPAATGSTAEPFQFFVQVGAFQSPEEAQSQRAKLTLMGLDARVSEREVSGRTMYRVRLGPYDRQGDAEKMRGDLQTNGLDSALVRVQR